MTQDNRSSLTLFVLFQHSRIVLKFRLRKGCIILFDHAAADTDDAYRWIFEAE
jgi:hypothetical protein